MSRAGIFAAIAGADRLATAVPDNPEGFHRRGKHDLPADPVLSAYAKLNLKLVPPTRRRRRA